MLRTIAFASLIAAAAFTSAAAEEKPKLSWTLGPITMTPTADGSFDASQMATLGTPGFFPGGPAVSAVAKNMPGIKEAEKKLRPLLEEEIKAYVGQVADSVHRIDNYTGTRP